MSLILFKIIASSAVFCISLGAFFIAKRFQIIPWHMKLAESFTCGVFLSAALFHMLPDAALGFHALQPIISIKPYFIAIILSLLGFLLFASIERWAIIHHQRRHTTEPHTTCSYLLTFMLSSHSIIAGAALGSNLNFESAFIIFIAIILHKGLASFALATSLLRHISHKVQRNTLFLLFALMTPAGIIIASTINEILQTHAGQFIASTLNAFTAGSFLYLGTLHATAKQIYTRQDTFYWLYIATLILGIMPMAALSLFV